MGCQTLISAPYCSVVKDRHSESEVSGSKKRKGFGQLLEEMTSRKTSLWFSRLIAQTDGIDKECARMNTTGNRKKLKD